MILLTAKAHHARVVAENLRKEDLDELALSTAGKDPVEVVLGLWVDSVHAEVIMTDAGEVAGIWGVAPVPHVPEAGFMWMLATPAIKSVSLSFLRECPRAIARAHAKYDVLVCTPWRENHLHLAWLNWCGFTASDPGHGHFIAYTHVWTPSNPTDHAGSDCGERCGPAQPAEQGH